MVNFPGVTAIIRIQKVILRTVTVLSIYSPGVQERRFSTSVCHGLFRVYSEELLETLRLVPKELSNLTSQATTPCQVRELDQSTQMAGGDRTRGRLMK